MKNTITYTLLSLSLLVPSFTNLSAKEAKKAANGTPVAIKMVAPAISKSTRNGLTVEMKFTVTEEGKAAYIRPAVAFPNLRPEQRDLAAAAELALKQWTFEPALDSKGQPVATDVVIPITYRKDRVRDLSAQVVVKKAGDSKAVANKTEKSSKQTSAVN